MHRSYKIYKKIFITIPAVALLLIAGCKSVPESFRHGTPLPHEAELPEDKNNYVTMLAVGDNLIHLQLITDARNSETGCYEFESYYSEVAPEIAGADIAFINQETLIAGEQFGYSGYPAFNGPKELGDALVNIGFDVVNHATNHAMDKGEGAVYAVIDYWKSKPDILMLGLHESEEARDVKKNIVDVNNIKIGFLAYTYGLNGIPLPKNKPFLVSLINTEVMAKEIDALRPLCDFLVVSMHWGNEYEYSPDKRQEALARFLADHNVDLVIGHHPHVLQPVRRLEKKDGGAMLCYYSLGNFISAQNEAPRLLGGMMRIKIKQDENKTITIENAELIPLLTHYEKSGINFKVYFLYNYTDNLMMLHHLYRQTDKLTVNHFFILLKKIFGDLLVP
jgi:poly-gamma-glutamate synthesis protein (capsule biosynthesis protein)